ncbi:tetratricopeptide repeat protein [Thermopirellula anaerolimosa]
MPKPANDGGDASSIGPESSKTATTGEDARRSAGINQSLRYSRVVALAGAVVLFAAAGLAIWLNRPRPKPLEEVAAKAEPETAALILETSHLVEDTLALFPNDVYAWDLAGRMYSRFGKTEQARLCWEKCLELDENFVPAHQALGVAALESGDLKAAAEHYRKAWRLSPESSVYPTQLAEVLIQDGQLAAARDVLREALRRHPRAVAMRALLGQALVQLREDAEAVEHLSLVVRMNPEYTNGYYPLATALDRLGRREEAAEMRRLFQERKRQDELRHREQLKDADMQAEAVRVSVAQAYVSAAKIHISAGDTPTAEQYLTRAVELAPQFTEAALLMAWLKNRMGDRAAARARVERLLESQPAHLETIMQAAKLFAEWQDYDRAEALYRQAIELTPYEAGGYLALADLYVSTGKRPFDAQVLALKAVAREPAAACFALLISAAQRNGDLITAAAAAREAVRLEPDNPNYQQIAKALGVQP